MGSKNFYNESSIDHVRDVYAPTVFINPEDLKPELKPTILNQIQHHVGRFGNLFKVTKFFIKGSILTKQYNDSADIDVYIQGNIPDSEAVKNKIEEVWNELDGQMASGTKHPLQYYVTDKAYDFKNTEAAYDVGENRWIKQTPPKEIDHEKYIDSLYNAYSNIDFLTGELRRDVIDHEIIQQIPSNQLGDVERLANNKMSEIEYDIQILVNAYNEIKDARGHAFSDDLTPAELAEYGRQTHMPGNVIFKFLERYFYLQLLRELRDIIGKDNELQDHEYDKLKGKLEPFDKFFYNN
ncbi:hypothetical protein H8E06_00370 [bacterium]|nr:hypothetical protein [bacterium]